MTSRPAQPWRGVAVALLFIAWAIAAHLGSAGHGHPDFNTALGVLPLVVVAVLLINRLPQAWLKASLGLAGLLGLTLLWPDLRDNVPLLYYLQHLGTHVALGLFFGRTLRGPGEALITRIARRVYNGQISPLKARYTRQVTIAWTIFFFANASVSTALFLLGPAWLWSIHANLLTGPLIGAMFLGEHLVRLRVLPPHERPSFFAAIQAYRQTTAQRADPATKQP